MYITPAPAVRGTIIILTEEQEDDKTEFLLQYLFLYLPAKGWNTVQIKMPKRRRHQYDHAVIGEDYEFDYEISSTIKLGTYPTDKLDLMEQSLNIILSDAIGFALEKTPVKTKHNILISSHYNASKTLHAINNKVIPAPSLLVLIDPYLQGNQSQHDLFLELLYTTVPLMEITHINGPDKSIKQRQQRIQRLINSRHLYRIYESKIKKNSMENAQKILSDINGFAWTVMNERLIKNAMATELKTKPSLIKKKIIGVANEYYLKSPEDNNKQENEQ